MLGLINHFTSVYLLTGYVIAFRLDSLLQLIIDTRGTENKKTPMHNLCKGWHTPSFCTKFGSHIFMY